MSRSPAPSASATRSASSTEGRTGRAPLPRGRAPGGAGEVRRAGQLRCAGELRRRDHVRTSVTWERPDPPPEAEHVDGGGGATSDDEVDGRARCFRLATRTEAHGLPADVRVSGASGGSDGADLAGLAVGGRPFGGVRVVLDEEWWQARIKARCRSQAPADDLAIGMAPLTGHRLCQVGSAGTNGADIVVDGVGRDRPRRETASALQGAERRRADPRDRREIGVEDADQLEIGVTEPDEAVVCAKRVVTPTAPDSSPSRVSRSAAAASGSATAMTRWSMPRRIDAAYAHAQHGAGRQVDRMAR